MRLILRLYCYKLASSVQFRHAEIEKIFQNCGYLSYRSHDLRGNAYPDAPRPDIRDAERGNKDKFSPAVETRQSL